MIINFLATQTLVASKTFRIIIHSFKLEMQPNIVFFVLLALLFIASTSYARPTPEQYLPDMKGEAMLKQQNLTDMRNSGLSKKLKSDTKEKLVENAIEDDDPLLFLNETKTVDEFGPGFPIYGGPLFRAKKTVSGKPKP